MTSMYVKLFITIFVVVVCELNGLYGGVLQDRIKKRDTAGRGGCNCECGIGNRQMRVVGGNITKIHEFPWLAGISVGGEFICGASLITRRHILTAAHCVNGFNARQVTIVLGDHDRNSQDRYANIIVKQLKSIQQHEAFNPKNYNNDIAVLELEDPVKYGVSIQPACLPDPEILDYSGRFGVVAGWGRIAEGDVVSHILKKAVVPVWTKEECYSSGYAKNKLSENMFCAGYPDGKQDACRGDSGGPLHMNNEHGNMAIIGLVSWGRGCARPNYPGVYTKVTNYIDWIHEALKGECLCPTKHIEHHHYRRA